MTNHGTNGKQHGERKVLIITKEARTNLGQAMRYTAAVEQAHAAEYMRNAELEGYKIVSIRARAEDAADIFDTMRELLTTSGN